MADRMFTLKKWQQMKRDIFDDFFAQNDINFDAKGLDEKGLLSENLRQRLGLGSPEDGEPEEQLEGEV